MIRRALPLCMLLAACVYGHPALASQAFQEEWKAYLETVATETPEEAIDQLDGPFPTTAQQHMQLRMRRGQPFDTAQELLGEDPRMRALRRSIARAEPERREELVAAVIAKLESVLAARKELDERPQPGEAPSGLALITLAAQYDRTGDALPVLLAWYEAEDEGTSVVDGSEAHYIPSAAKVILERLDKTEDDGFDQSGSIHALMLEEMPQSQREPVMASVRARLGEPHE